MGSFVFCTLAINLKTICILKTQYLQDAVLTGLGRTSRSEPRLTG